MSIEALLAGLGVAVWGSRFGWLMLQALRRGPGRGAAPPADDRRLALAARRHFGGDVDVHVLDDRARTGDEELVVVPRSRAADSALAGPVPVLSVLDSPPRRTMVR